MQKGIILKVAFINHTNLRCVLFEIDLFLSNAFNFVRNMILVDDILTKKILKPL